MMFFVADVETGCTTPSIEGMLSIGIVAVDKDPTGPWVIRDKFYTNLAYDDRTFEESTIQFWNDQEEEVKQQAFDWTQNRIHPASAVKMIEAWVTGLEPDPKKSFFVANPASFDYGWVLNMFAAFDTPMPFSHRTLCLRSMEFGMIGGEYGQKRSEEFASVLLHHGLHDAFAEALHLMSMLNKLES